MVWISSIFSLWSPVTVSAPSNKISLLKRQHWPITNMSESTHIQGLSKSFEYSNYSYPSHTTCIAQLSPSSLCYPWSPAYHPSNHITFYLMWCGLSSLQIIFFNDLPHALSSSFDPYAARSLFPCVQTITNTLW